MKKTILITLAPLLIIDAYVTTSLNYKKTAKSNEAASAQPIKRLHDPKTMLIFSDNTETGKDILIRTPSLYNGRSGKSIPSSPNRIDIKAFF